MKNNSKILIASLLSLSTISISSADLEIGTKFKDFVDSITTLIGDTVAGLLITVAVSFFILSIVMFLKNRALGSGGQVQKDAKERLLWSIIGLFVLFSVWGIVKFLQVGFGFNTTSITTPTLSVGGGGWKSDTNTNSLNKANLSDLEDFTNKNVNCASISKIKGSDGKCYPGQGNNTQVQPKKDFTSPICTNTDHLGNCISSN